MIEISLLVEIILCIFCWDRISSMLHGGGCVTCFTICDGQFGKESHEIAFILYLIVFSSEVGQTDVQNTFFRSLDHIKRVN